MFRRGLWQDAVPEVEDKRPAAQSRPNPVHLLLHDRSTNQQRHRIEIALHHDIRLQLVAGKVG